MDYKKYNDYELIYNVKENDEYSYNCLFNKYIPIMKKLAYRYYSYYSDYGYDLDDFQQEAFISFYNAVDSYNENKNSLFYSFVVLCINRALLSFCRKISCEKKNISNKLLVNIDELINFGTESNIDKYFIDNESNDFLKNICLELDFDDSCVIELRYNGFSYKEISILLDIPLKKVQLKGRKVNKLLNSKKK